MLRTSLFAFAASSLLATSALTGCALTDDIEGDLVDAEAIATSDDAVGAMPRTVFVHLFEWKWTDIAQECEQFLGPRGFAGVQVSPPNEHVILAGQPWYQRYQPVSYKLESRSGTRAEFIDMVNRCKAVGVDIYVDAVINHMSAQDSGGGSAGTQFSHYNYPGLYQSWDFHHCGRNGNEDIQNYNDRWEVQTCELVNLADLDTGSEYVRGKIAGYLSDLLSIGVAGFRVDASKHMAAGDLGAILGKAPGTKYVYQEVIDQGGEPIKASEYFQNGDVTEFRYSLQIGQTFKAGKLAWLDQFGAAWGFMPSDNAVVFTDNHDNQRGHGGAGDVVTHKDGALYDLANVFMLAWPYGYPQVMSSYAFTDGSQGPPSDANGKTKSVYTNGQANCFGEWVCEHRWRPITNMVQFRNVTSSAPGVADWWSNGNNQIAFSRGDKGFVAINREAGSLSRTFKTGLAAGSYCDVISGEMAANGASCTGTTVTVDAQGNASITVGSMNAVALHASARLSSVTPGSPGTGPQQPPAGTVTVTFQVNAQTVWGQDVYVVGNLPALGSWSPQGIKLDPASYPVWKGTVSLPAGTAIEYKYIKREGANVVWETGSNRTLTTPATGGTTLNESFR